MKVLYLDLNYPDLVENYGTLPDSWGGGRIIATHLMPWMAENGHEMQIWADEKSFRNVDPKYKQYCKHLSEDSKSILRAGGALKVFSTEFDIVLHNFYGVKVDCSGTKTKDLVWCVGYGERVNLRNERVVLYNNYQGTLVHPNTKVYKARIGVPLPEFQEYKKDNYLFSCHRQAAEFGSEWMMKLAHKWKLKYIAAGPMDQSFKNLMDYVDNKYVTYLGPIKEEAKIEYLKHARASTHLHRWNTPFNLGAISSLAYGTPCITTDVGFWPSLITNGVNGQLIDDDEGFLASFEICSLISQKSCYNSVLEYSSEKMISDYMKVFEDVLKYE